MAAGASPTIYDPKMLAQGALSTTLTTTLYTAPAEAGVRIDGIIVCCTGTTSRKVTIDLYDGATGRKILNAVPIPTDGVGVNVLELIGKKYLFIDSGDLIRGGQDVGTDIDFNIDGVEMKD